MEEHFRWSEEQYSVADLIINKDQFPLLIKVAGEESDAYNYTVDGSEGRDLRPGQIYRIKEFGFHHRAICVTEDGTMYSIPLDYPLKFFQVTPGSLSPTRTGGNPRTLSELVHINKDGIPFDVSMETVEEEFKVGAETRHRLDLGVLTVIDVISEKFMKANVFRKGGFLSKSVAVITHSDEGHFHVAEALNGTFTYTWDNLLQALQKITTSIDYSKASPNLAILKYSEPLYICEHQARRPPSINNSEENEKLYQQLKLTTFATLVRRSRSSGDACISKTINDLSAKNVRKYGPPTGSPDLNKSRRLTGRRGSDSSLLNLYGIQGDIQRGRPSYKKGSRPSVKLQLLRSQKAAPVKTCCPACLASGETYMCMHGFKRGPAPPPQPDGIYEEISDYNMDVKVSDILRMDASAGNRSSATSVSSRESTASAGGHPSVRHTLSSSSSVGDDTYLNPLPSPTVLPAHPLLLHNPARRGSLPLPDPPRKHTPQAPTRQSMAVPPSHLIGATVDPPPPPVRTSFGRSSSIIGTMRDVPDDVGNLTLPDVLKCLQLMNMDDYGVKFEKHQVNGELLKGMSVEDFKASFHMTPIEATKLYKFANKGWRPDN